MEKVTNEYFENSLKNQDYLNIINGAAKKYQSLIPKDDLIQCKHIGLWNALLKYNNNLAKFTTFLYLNVKFQCLIYLESRKRFSKDYSILEDVISNKNNLDDLAFEEMIDFMSEDNKLVLKQKFVQNMTLHEIGAKNGYSHEKARKNIKKALSMIKDKYFNK